MPNILTLRPLDLDNGYQRSEAAGIMYTVAHRAFEGRLATMYLSGDRPYNWRPELDGRTAEMRAFVQAEKELLDALSKYDRARIAAHAKAKEAKK